MVCQKTANSDSDEAKEMKLSIAFELKRTEVRDGETHVLKAVIGPEMLD